MWEKLEQRKLLSITLMSDGTLVRNGEPATLDDVNVFLNNNTIQALHSKFGKPFDESASFSPALVKSIQVSTGALDDQVDIDPAIKVHCSIDGGSGDDILGGGGG